MNFGVPSAFLWSLLAIPIVIFYILKIRLRRVPVSTVMFWNQIFDEKKPRSIWQQLRHLLSLLLQLAFLSLLVFAITDPFFHWEKLKAKRVVLVVDNSASMQASDVDPTRLHVAKGIGFELIRGLRLRDQMAIVSAGSVPRVEVGLTSHQRTLRGSLEAIPQTDGPTGVASAVELARRLLADHENSEVVVLSDGCFAEAKEIDAAEDVRLVSCGKKTANVGITQFQVRRSLIDTIGYQILVEVSNFSDEPVACRLEVNLPDELVDVVPLKLEPGEKWSNVLEQTSSNGGELVATIDVQDALTADNRAVALLPIRKPQKVILVSQGSLFLTGALNAIPLVDLELVDKLPEKVPATAIVVFHKETPAEIPKGNTMFIQPTTSTNMWQMGEIVSEPIIVKQDSDSSLMTHVQLENVIMPQARELEFTIPHRVLAESLGKQPMFASVEHAKGKTVVFNVELAKGDLPLRTAFPIMMTNSIAWFQGRQGELQQAIGTGELVACDLSDELMKTGTLKKSVVSNAGQTSSNRTESNASQADVSEADSQPDVVAVSNPSGNDSVQSSASAMSSASDVSDSIDKRLSLRGPHGETSTLPPNTAKLTLGPFDHVGVWQVGFTKAKDNQKATKDDETDSPFVGRAIYEVACNLANAEESDIRVEESENETARASRFGGRPIWFYLIALGLILSTIEWFLYQRRWIS